MGNNLEWTAGLTILAVLSVVGVAGLIICIACTFTTLGGINRRIGLLTNKLERRAAKRKVKNKRRQKRARQELKRLDEVVASDSKS